MLRRVIKVKPDQPGLLGSKADPLSVAKPAARSSCFQSLRQHSCRKGCKGDNLTESFAACRLLQERHGIADHVNKLVTRLQRRSAAHSESRTTTPGSLAA